MNFGIVYAVCLMQFWPDMKERAYLLDLFLNIIVHRICIKAILIGITYDFKHIIVILR